MSTQDFRNRNRNNTCSKGRQVLIALLLFFLCGSVKASPPIRIDSLSTTQLWIAAQVLPGSGQIISKQYWKVPVYYAGMGSMLYLGYKANNEYQNLKKEFAKPIYSPDEEYRFKEKWTAYRIERNLFFAGAASFYLASVADALVVNSKERHSPATATILSTLVPGLGQIYNGKLWKVPAVLAGFASLYYVYDFNQRGFNRFGLAYNQYPNDEFNGYRNKQELIYFRDAYRRNRDMAVITIVGFYLLNIIDANVDAHFFDWDISDNLALRFDPLVGSGYSANLSPSSSTVGFKMRLNF